MAPLWHQVPSWLQCAQPLQLLPHGKDPRPAVPTRATLRKNLQETQREQHGTVTWMYLDVSGIFIHLRSSELRLLDLWLLPRPKAPPRGGARCFVPLQGLLCESGARSSQCALGVAETPKSPRSRPWVRISINRPVGPHKPSKTWFPLAKKTSFLIGVCFFFNGFEGPW